MPVTAPRREVCEVRELVGPRGGTVLVMLLECGHLIWRRMKQPPLHMRCPACWWGPRPPVEAPRLDDDDNLLLLTSRDELFAIWDALVLWRRAGDPGDALRDDGRRVLERVGDLLSR